MSQNLRILTLTTDLALRQRLDGLLTRRSLEVNRVPSGAGALILTGNLKYDLIVAQHPLADLALEDFLSSLRTIESSSTGTAVLVVASPDNVARLASGLDPDLVSVVGSNADESELHEAISALLGVAVRRNARTMVEVELVLNDSISTHLFQTENLSETGLLMRGARKIPVGSAVRFSLKLPLSADAVDGTALVARHTAAGEPVLGAALQFAELSEDNLLRLRRYLEANAPVTPSTLGISATASPTDQQRS